MNRGDIHWINLSDAEPPEMGKTRPGLVISNSEQNAILPTVVVVPISSQGSAIWPLRVPVSLGKGKASYAIIPGIRQVSRRRILEQIHSLDGAATDKIAEAIRLYLS